MNCLKERCLIFLVLELLVVSGILTIMIRTISVNLKLEAVMQFLFAISFTVKVTKSIIRISKMLWKETMLY